MPVVLVPAVRRDAHRKLQIESRKTVDRVKARATTYSSVVWVCDRQDRDDGNGTDSERNRFAERFE